MVTEAQAVPQAPPQALPQILPQAPLQASPQAPPQAPPQRQNLFSSIATRASQISQTATQISAPASRTLLTSVSNLGQTLQKGARGLPETVTNLSQTLGQKARGLPGEIVGLPGRLEKERTEFIKQKSAEEKEPKAGSEPVAPWMGFEQFEEELKLRITSLSTDKRNFLVDPPKETGFQFDMAVYQRTALAALNADPKLDRMRFTLVPREVKEPVFWRNYFYRVSLIKQSVLNSEKMDDGSVFEGGEKHTDEVLFDSVTGDEDPAAWIDREVGTTEKKAEPAAVQEKAPETTKSAATSDEAKEEFSDWEKELRMELAEAGEA